MGATFIITLREAFEAFLVLGIVYSYLERIGARLQFHWVTWGAVLGLLASLALGVAVGMLSGPLADLGPDLIGLVVIFGAVVLLTWHGWWMRQHAREIKGDLHRRIDTARATQRYWIVGLIAFTAVFREGAETVLFLWGLLAQAAITRGWDTALGGVLGVSGAAVLGWAIFRGGRRVSLPRFFAITTGLILLLAAGLFSTGVGRLQGLGWLPMTEPLWDTSAVLNDRSLVGSFLGGLVGYRARPTAAEVIAYVAYVIFAAALMFGVRGTSVRRDPGATAGPAQAQA